MNVYHVIVVSGLDTDSYLAQGSHISAAVGRVLRNKKRTVRDTAVKVIAKRVAVGQTLAEYQAQQTPT